MCALSDCGQSEPSLSISQNIKWLAKISVINVDLRTLNGVPRSTTYDRPNHYARSLLRFCLSGNRILLGYRLSCARSHKANGRHGRKDYSSLLLENSHSFTGNWMPAGSWTGTAFPGNFQEKTDPSISGFVFTSLSTPHVLLPSPGSEVSSLRYISLSDREMK